MVYTPHAKRFDLLHYSDSICELFGIRCVRPLQAETNLYNQGALGKRRACVQVKTADSETFEGFAKRPFDNWDKMMITTINDIGDFDEWEATFYLMNQLGDETGFMKFAAGDETFLELGPFLPSKEGRLLAEFRDKQHMYLTPCFPLLSRGAMWGLESQLPTLVAQVHDAAVFANAVLGGRDSLAPNCKGIVSVSHPKLGFGGGKHRPGGKLAVRYEKTQQVHEYDRHSWRVEGLTADGSGAFPLSEDRADFLGRAMATIKSVHVAPAIQELLLLREFATEYPEQHSRMAQWDTQAIDNLPRFFSTNSLWPAFFLKGYGDRARLVPGVHPAVMQSRVLDAYFMVMAPDSECHAECMLGEGGLEDPLSATGEAMMAALKQWSGAARHKLIDEEFVLLALGIQCKAALKVLEQYQLRARSTHQPEVAEKCNCRIKTNMMLIEWLYRHQSQVNSAVYYTIYPNAPRGF